ncbi:unnamed protein product [Sphagnum troendelagicum]|uniref:SBP-type domain-containing protein n=1 Tax=Sphagnum troendelagicum TaxID=128251 RepID=A0ABP0UAP9_9BRYO
MGHSEDTTSGWDWDSVLLLVNPAVDTTSDELVRETLDSACGFSVGQSWPEFEDLHSSRPGNLAATVAAEETTTKQQQQNTQTGPQSSDTVEKAVSRKEGAQHRDPRLDCPNFLAGRVPCACTDNEEEDEGGSQSKRVKLSARCQVPSCAADLASLKGYHQRHRVCLRCANASSVKLHQHLHRYCQQCGRFHVLSDFDDEKRSCRRKLERHNNRRRRKVQESGDDTATLTIDNDNPSPDEGKDGKSTGEEKATADREMQSEVDQSHNLIASTLAPPLVEQSKTTEEAHASLMDGSANPKPSNSNSPRRQIVEKGEVGVRKGGVDEDSLLALLLEESPNEVDGLPLTSDLQPRISSRELDHSSTYTSRYPSGRISFKLYDWNPGDFPRNLRQQILQWLSNMPVELEGYIRSGCTILTLFIAMPQSMWDKLLKFVLVVTGQVVNRSGGKDECMPCMPVLHSVQPICFEAGIEGHLTVFGHNLLQPNTRLLVSTGGKYLDACVVQSQHGNKLDKYQIIVPALKHSQVGPVFIEVENEGRTSNSMSVLVGDRDLCSALERLDLQASRGCEQDLVFDLCWMLRDSSCQDYGACSRLQDLFLFAKACGWVRLAEYLLQVAGRKGMLSEVLRIDDMDPTCADKTFWWGRNMDTQGLTVLPAMDFEWDDGHLLPTFRKSGKYGEKDTHVILLKGRDALVPLLAQRRQRGSCNQHWGAHRVMAVVASVTVACAGVCLVLQHPNEVIQMSTSLRRCLWGQ